MKLKGFKKLSLQIGVISLSMIALSFFTETKIWDEYFTYLHDVAECHQFPTTPTIIYGPHIHLGYRGWVYILTGIAYFAMSVYKIITSHKKTDFKN